MKLTTKLLILVVALCSLLSVAGVYGTWQYGYQPTTQTIGVGLGFQQLYTIESIRELFSKPDIDNTNTIHRKILVFYHKMQDEKWTPLDNPIYLESMGWFGDNNSTGTGNLYNKNKVVPFVVEIHYKGELSGGNTKSAYTAVSIYTVDIADQAALDEKSAEKPQDWVTVYKTPFTFDADGTCQKGDTVKGMAPCCHVRGGAKKSVSIDCTQWAELDPA